MNTLSLENINKHAPYGVRHRENDCYSFYFETDFGLKYTISFMFENSFVQSGAFQFCINVEGAGRSPGDIKLRQTVYIIRTAEGVLDGIKNFTALFSRKDNPRLEELLAEFEETISIVFD